MSPLLEMKKTLKSLTLEEKRTAALLSLCYFFILVGYSIVRSMGSSLFLKTFGASLTPLANLATVLVLTVTVFSVNFFQGKHSVQKIFLGFIGFTLALWILCFELMERGVPELSFPFFIWKEIYIVILIHMLWAYAIHYYTVEKAKVVFGFVSAVGSMGGLLGGFFLSSFIASVGFRNFFYISVTVLAVASLFFRKTPESLEKEKKSAYSPIGSLGPVATQVAFMAGLVILTQFYLAVVELGVNTEIAARFPNSKEESAAYFGFLFGWVHTLTMIFKITSPILFSFLSPLTVQIMIPLVLLFSQFVAGTSAITFVIAKATDYSIFNISKDLLFGRFASSQKYGAKYLVDMLLYRTAKGTISTFLIFVQAAPFLATMNGGFLVFWLLLAVLQRPAWNRIKTS